MQLRCTVVGAARASSRQSEELLISSARDRRLATECRGCSHLGGPANRETGAGGALAGVGGTDRERCGKTSRRRRRRACVSFWPGGGLGSIGECRGGPLDWVPRRTLAGGAFCPTGRSFLFRRRCSQSCRSCGCLPAPGQGAGFNRPPGRGARLNRPPGQGARLNRPPGQGARLNRPPGQGARLNRPPGQGARPRLGLRSRKLVVPDTVVCSLSSLRTGEVVRSQLLPPQQWLVCIST